MLERVRYVRDYPFLINDLDPLFPGLYRVERAILYLEDRRFFLHRGAEFLAIPRLLRRLLTGKRPGGISTIEQQIVRLVLNRRERTIRRKSREIILALCLGFHVTKRQLLRTYIADAYFGEGVLGAEAASTLVFRKPYGVLTEEEASWIAALLPHPMPSAFIARMSGTREVWPVGQIRHIAAEVAPAWARRVDRRYQYVLAGSADFIPKRR